MTDLRPILSVILCTHNPRPDYFARCLDALSKQTLGTDAWDLLIVDNASEPAIASRVGMDWPPNAQILVEPRLGLTPARLAGIRAAKGDLLVFVDDDNVLDPDFLEVARRTALERPFLGAWSGQCRPDFEQAPPEWTRRYWGNLVIREFKTDVWSNLPRLAATMPCGAGLCVRRDVAMRYIALHDSGARAMDLDRKGSSLMSGGDNDLAACACDAGLGVGLVSALRLTHLMPPFRLTEDYLVRLTEGIYYSSVLIAHARNEREELASYPVRWHEPLRALLLRGPHRRMRLASLRGRRRGLAAVSSKP
jgi:glycosyltransferase involved in cell wall biosynthesis